MVELQEVFGIARDIPKYTYVDRSGLDKKFEYLLKTQRHIVVHGASKQGKSCLRKKNLDEEHCIIIQCLPSMDKTADIWNAAFIALGVKFPKENSITKSNEKNIGGNISGNAKIPLIIKVEGKIGYNSSWGKSSTEGNFSPEGYNENLKVLANKLIKEEKRLVLEDFHYLNEVVRKGIAFSLKALYELGVYVIIIGIWSEQNLLTYYNGDLTGRIEEIILKNIKNTNN